jgi:predicted anti-sigma-YlaC factor YlaD
MRCDEAKEALDAARYEGRAAASGEARAHLDACADCRAFEARSHVLERVLAVDAGTEPRPGFDTRFFARLDEIKRSRRRRWLLLGLGSSALAAAAGWMVFVRSPRQEPADDVELAANLEMVEDLDLLKRLDEVEAYAALSRLDPADVEAVEKEGR